MHSVAGWGGRAETEPSVSPVVEERSRGEYVLSPAKLFVTFTGKQQSFLTHQPCCFCLPPGGSMGEFSKKKASLGYFLSVDPSNSSHVSNSLRLSVYGRMSSPPPPGEKGLEPCLAGLRSEGRGRTRLPSQQKSLQKSGPALERHRERSGGRTSWEEV